MQTKYYLSFEQVGIIRRIPLKEQDPGDNRNASFKHRCFL